ncbi:MAG TPA: L-serine ammonia-lyase [Desulfobulbus sp.]|nr:L-serine ammonia-lyase [Desulfobulbus sp.]
MFISVLELFTIGIGPSSSHTVGPMVAAENFRHLVQHYLRNHSPGSPLHIRCTLKDSLAYTGKGHATDIAVTLGLHGYLPDSVAEEDIRRLYERLRQQNAIALTGRPPIVFSPDKDILFDFENSLPRHPNGMVCELLDRDEKTVLSETYFSIGGGFISTLAEIDQVVAPLQMSSARRYPYPFDSARSMLRMAAASGLSISDMKRENEQKNLSSEELNNGLDGICRAMFRCVNNGLSTEGVLPGGLELPRRAKFLHDQLRNNPQQATINDWLCAYAMAVSEENGAGHMVVTAPTNGAAGVIPAILYYLVHHQKKSSEQLRTFLLTAAAIGGIIKHRSSVSGAEVGCQGEIGSAASMAAAGLCAVMGGTPEQIENGAEIALEHHLGMTCDPVNGLVQVPCIERNGFGAVKAYTAASLAMHGSGQHFMPLDGCIAAMKQTGMEMSTKFKETSLGGLAVSISEC